MIFVGKHPNVVSLLGACTKNGEINLQVNFVITVDSSKYIKVNYSIDFCLLFVTCFCKVCKKISQPLVNLQFTSNKWHQLESIPTTFYCFCYRPADDNYGIRLLRQSSKLLKGKISWRWVLLSSREIMSQKRLVEISDQSNGLHQTDISLIDTVGIGIPWCITR